MLRIVAYYSKPDPHFVAHFIFVSTFQILFNDFATAFIRDHCDDLILIITSYIWIFIPYKNLSLTSQWLIHSPVANCNVSYLFLKEHVMYSTIKYFVKQLIVHLKNNKKAKGGTLGLWERLFGYQTRDLKINNGDKQWRNSQFRVYLHESYNKQIDKNPLQQWRHAFMSLRLLLYRLICC